MDATQEDTTMRAAQEATQESKRTTVVFEEDKMKLIEFLRDNELLYNKGLMDCKDQNKREALWDKFWAEMDKASYTSWFLNQRTMNGKITQMKSDKGAPHFTDKQNWLRRNLGFSTSTLCVIIPQSAFKPAREVTVSRPPMLA